MSPTIHAGTIIAAGDYPTLVRARREFGDRRFGDRHLTRDDLLANLLVEAADTLVYLTLETRRWLKQLPATAHIYGDDLADLRAQAITFGERCEHALCRLTGPGSPPFGRVFDARMAFGDEHYGMAYLERDNLAEGLEEIADAQILVALEADRRRHCSELTEPDRQLLDRLDANAHRLGLAVFDLRARALSPQRAAA